MLRAVLKYKDGISRIFWVDSSDNGNGGYYVRNFVTDSERVFQLKSGNKKTPTYEEIETSVEDFYGYEKKTAD